MQRMLRTCTNCRPAKRAERPRAQDARPALACRQRGHSAALPPAAHQYVDVRFQGTGSRNRESPKVWPTHRSTGRRQRSTGFTIREERLRPTSGHGPGRARPRPSRPGSRARRREFVVVQAREQDRPPRNGRRPSAPQRARPARVARLPLPGWIDAAIPPRTNSIRIARPSISATTFGATRARANA